MKQNAGQQNIFTNSINLLCGFILSALLIFVPAVFSSVYAAATNYTDPTGYPGNWPTDLQWIPYTTNGSNITDLAGGAGGDASTGGTAPAGSVDVVGVYGPAVSWYGNGTNLYFRMQLNNSPIQATGTGKPFSSATWNILLDTDGDGYKEFVVHIDGTGGGQTQADDIVVIYENTAIQSFTVTGGLDTIWRQDSADNPSDTTLQTVDGELGNNASDYDNDGSPGGPDYDFLRTRVTDIDGSVTYLDFQVPLSALDATAKGGPVFTASTPFAMGFSTSNSNSNPVQKDFAYAGTFTASATSPIPFGDFVDPSGNTLDEPIIQSLTTSGCGNASLSTTILDSTKLVSGAVHSTVTTEFYYYYDADSDGVANDAGSDWYKIGDGAPTNNLPPWTYSWDSTGLYVGQYLLKVIATDEQANIVDSSTLGTPIIAIHNNSCGLTLPTEVVDIANTTDASGMGVKAVNADPASTITTSKTVIRTQGTTFNLFARNEGTISQAFDLTVDSDGAGQALPGGLTVSFTDTGGTPITSTTVLNPGDTFEYRAVVSTTAAITFGSHSLYFYVTGVTDSTATDVKQDAVSISNGVDLANSAGATGMGNHAVDADPSSSVTTTLTAKATWTALFNLYINNESAINQSFDLSSDADGAGTPLPAGWAVVYKDTLGSTITSTAVVNAGDTYQYTAEITTPAGTADGTYPIFFYADGVTVAAASDVKQDALTIDSGLSDNIIDLASLTTATGFGSPGIDAHPDTVSTTTEFVEPGNTATFNLYAINEGGASKAFDLDAYANTALDSLPTGWTVVFKDSGGTVITSTPTIIVGSTFSYTAEVTPPAAVTELLLPVFFRVTPSTGSGGWNTNFVQVAVQVGLLADLSIVKTVDDATPQQGDAIVYTLTLNNIGPNAAAQLEVTDALPSGVTYVSDDGGGTYDDATNLWTPAALASGANVVLKISATINNGTGGTTITNTATITDSNRIDPVSTNDSSSVDITVVVPIFSVLKSTITVSDPFNGSTNPKAIPGSVMRYNIQITNSGLGNPDVDSMIISDPIPTNTALVVSGTPFTFVQGTPTSNLTFTYTSLASMTDDVEFSDDSGATWTYTPVADGNGTDLNVTNIRFNPKGTMEASDGTNHPNFTLQFQVRVQ
jgi:uncharacterized repeat protein (TIGR01451 family)